MMDSSDDDLDGDDSEWRNSFVDSAPAAVSGPAATKPAAAASVHRVILHFDLDCFYAQVEMIRNPSLRNVPLGIQQKYIIVTCNYVARERGVTKLMSVTDATEKCPELVLVKGEDLTHYREMSYKVTELLLTACPLVERLGFDENFVDVTELVEKRLKETVSFSFAGHVYNHSSAEVDASEHPRLAVGSHIAAELRVVIQTKLGLTGCAGVATNKLLAKLVSSTFKPNQQTVLLQESVCDIMGSLGSVRKVPGVGHQTAKKLLNLGVVSVKDLQLFLLSDLEREFGGPGARRLKNLSLGVDDSPVNPTGAPQSLSDEDSFKKMCSTKEVLEKVRDLLDSLMERMHRDGRQPQTFRLTIRKYSATNKWFSRESRQCPIPSHIGQKISAGCVEEAVVQLVPLAMKLFHKMVESCATFHLTLINVCFSNLQSRGAVASGRGAITSFFTQSSSPGKRQTSSQTRSDEPSGAASHRTPPNMNSEMIPIQEELLNSVSDSSACAPVLCDSQDLNHRAPLPPTHSHTDVEERRLLDWSAVAATSEGNQEERDKRGEGSALPGNVDPAVFSELPPEVQRELRAEWELQRGTPPAKRAKSKTASRGKDIRTVGRGAQRNNLLKYFKPS